MGKRGNAEWPDEKIIAAKLERRKLLDQRSNPEWPNWAEEIRAVRLELRKLLAIWYPKAIPPAVMRCIVESGGDYDFAVAFPRSLKRVSREDRCPSF